MSIDDDIKTAIEKIFDKKSVDKISVDELHEVSSRIFVETLGELNRLNDELTGLIAGNDDGLREKRNEIINKKISHLEREYHSNLDLIIKKIIESSKDQKSFQFWLIVANNCKKDGNDFLGLA